MVDFNEVYDSDKKKDKFEIYLFEFYNEKIYFIGNRFLNLFQIEASFFSITRSIFKKPETMNDNHRNPTFHAFSRPFKSHCLQLLYDITCLFCFVSRL